MSWAGASCAADAAGALRGRLLLGGRVDGGRLRVGLRVGGDELVGGLAAVHVLRGLARGLGRGVHDTGARGPAGSAAGARGRLGAGGLGEGLLRAASRGLGDAGFEAGARGLGGGHLDGLGDALGHDAGGAGAA
ncbi:hypothetical protein [Clavibacter michiganensis]|uniref:hypothetical protein n=1 Tax=Clavibacter michiganensis TaxID=28447 RepID=UPI00292FEB6C|nr:hypothetical protein [Clavibacter michiganensis]